MTPRTCRHPDGCDRAAKNRGLCPKHYMTWWTRQRAYGRFQSRRVPAGPARAHVRELQAAGLGYRRIAELAGVNSKTIRVLVAGRSDRGTPPPSYVMADTARAILAVDPVAAAPAGGVCVDATGTRRRLQALVAFGWTQRALAHRMDWDASNLGRIVDDGQVMITCRTASAVAALFAELELTPGPSNRARRYGRARGWPVPLQWDEDTIDDPTARPVGEAWSEASARRERAEQRAERAARAAELTARGASAREIAARFGVSDRTIVRDRRSTA